MNLYFLVEGKRSERRLYPAWLQTLLPKHTRVTKVEGASADNYFLISGEGYPSILGDHLEKAIVDCNNFPAYSHLVLCLDSEDDNVQQRLDMVTGRRSEINIELERAQLKVIVQHRCLETWLLGNRDIVTHAPQGELKKFLSFYNVKTNCPELMGRPSNDIPHAAYHGRYLRALFQDKNIRYSKRDPGAAAQPYYLQTLLDRVSDNPEHLTTFQTLAKFCDEVRRLPA